MDQAILENLGAKLKGDFFLDKTMLTLYATDASAYQELPLAVAVPEDKEDIKVLVNFARENKTSLIPRTAGTSLAGQVVGNGIVVDVSRKMTRILELNQEENWVRLQPGVVRDELNYFLADYGLFFGPETSTANRAMIGGMVGNNSCGTNSVVYGSTREHLLSVKAILADGSETEFGELTMEALEAKVNADDDSLETRIYRDIYQMLTDKDNQEEIFREFPKPSVPRRNTGYALDMLLRCAPFDENGSPFNFCKLIAGSEGTLAFITEIKLNVVPLPPPNKGLVCAHFDTVDESLRGNTLVLDHNPSASELMDHHVLERTKTNIAQKENRFFVKGDPGAILVVELTRDSMEAVERDAQALIEDFKANGLGYHFPVVTGDDIKRVWTLRKAGLGLLSNIPGDAKPVPVIEDTAVDVLDLPEYIREFNEILGKHDMSCVHYAHAGSGELHLRPILNLKTKEGNRLFRVIADEIAHLVKKYRGSLSGEHGDGRLRGEFIKFMVGDKNYKLIEQIKHTWDPYDLFNPGKIVDTPPMNEQLRYVPGQVTPQFDTIFSFEQNKGVLRAAEQCNGSGDCRKTELSGGTMCPSYMATRNEKDTTRARANILREFLTNSTQENRFAHEEIYDVMDLCLACKGCKSECPSNVDIAKLKTEFLQHYYDEKGLPFRTWVIGNFTSGMALASLMPRVYNFMATNKAISKIMKAVIGFAPDRSMPLLHQTTLRKWYKRHKAGLHKAQASGLTAALPNPVAKDYVNKATGNNIGKNGKVYLLCDEFTNYNDTDAGIKAILLLERLGYEVEIPRHKESGRTYLSKGLLRKARDIAYYNIDRLKDLITEDTPIIGLEPSAILTLRDEYPDLADEGRAEGTRQIADNTYLFEEFLAREIDKGNIKSEQFTSDERLIKMHGHCHQKALSTMVPSKKVMELPQNYKVHMIQSGCCGMAGSFGYEKEHFDISMKIGELVLFPEVRKQPEEVLIAAPGTSCRHQVKDGTGRQAMHPAEILFEALK